MLTLRAAGVSGEATRLTQGIEVGATAREDLVHIRLMAGVPQNCIRG